jgi:hypothetical protein
MKIRRSRLAGEPGLQAAIGVTDMARSPASQLLQWVLCRVHNPRRAQQRPYVIPIRARHGSVGAGLLANPVYSPPSM